MAPAMALAALAVAVDDLDAARHSALLCLRLDLPVRAGWGCGCCPDPRHALFGGCACNKA